MSKIRFLLLCLGVALTPAGVIHALSVADGVDWREQATATTEVGIDNWQSVMREIMLATREIERQETLQVDRNLYAITLDAEQVELQPGDYRCASNQFHAYPEQGKVRFSYPFFECRLSMENGERILEKLTGSQRFRGTLLPASDLEGDVLLGTWQVSEEAGYLDYGKKTERNHVGLVQSLGDGRWRMIEPPSAYGGLGSVLEIAPLP